MIVWIETSSCKERFIEILYIYIFYLHFVQEKNVTFVVTKALVFFKLSDCFWSCLSFKWTELLNSCWHFCDEFLFLITEEDSTFLFVPKLSSKISV